MADVSKIKLPSGTTYNIKDTVSGYTKNTGTITSVKTTAGAHTAINVSSGAAAFNVPTKTSHLTNDSGFLTSHLTGTGAIDVSNNKISLKLDTKPVVSIIKSTVNGISGLALILDDGSTDGEGLFIPDGNGFYTGSQAIINQIPTKTSDLTNDSSFVTESWVAQVLSEFITFNNFIKNNITISASSTTTVTIDISKEGYTPKGIIRIQKSGTAQAEVALNRFQIDGNEAQIGLLNTKNSERTVNIGITVLYQKTAS